MSFKDYTLDEKLHEWKRDAERSWGVESWEHRKHLDRLLALISALEKCRKQRDLGARDEDASIIAADDAEIAEGMG